MHFLRSVWQIFDEESTKRPVFKKIASVNNMAQVKILLETKFLIVEKHWMLLHCSSIKYHSRLTEKQKMLSLLKKYLWKK